LIAHTGGGITGAIGGGTTLGLGGGAFGLGGGAIFGGANMVGGFIEAFDSKLNSLTAESLSLSSLICCGKQFTELQKRWNDLKETYSRCCWSEFGNGIFIAITENIEIQSALIEMQIILHTHFSTSSTEANPKEANFGFVGGATMFSRAC
jgi:hypothetical protein